ncbi:hypothetical protein MD484_g399, partial [Candolleomyces efflorescens]
MEKDEDGERALPNATHNSIRNLRQYVKITSFGSETFQEAHDQIERLRKRLQTQTVDEQVLPINFVPHEGSPCIEAHARYFTDRNLVPYEKRQPFGEFVDPFHVLADMKPDSFIHGQDNKVDYLERTTDRIGCVRHVPMDPGALRAGDIVEIAFCCVAVPIKEKRRLMFLNLRAVTLLDDSVRKAAEARQRLATPPLTPHKIVRFKRRQAYVDIDYSENESERAKKRKQDERREVEYRNVYREVDGQVTGETNEGIEREFSGMHVDH